MCGAPYEELLYEVVPPKRRLCVKWCPYGEVMCGAPPPHEEALYEVVPAMRRLCVVHP